MSAISLRAPKELPNHSQYGCSQISAPFDAAMPMRDGPSFSFSRNGKANAPKASRFLELAEPTDDLPYRRAEVHTDFGVPEYTLVRTFPTCFCTCVLHQHHANGLRVCVHSLSFAL